VGLSSAARWLYARVLRHQLRHGDLPGHVAVIMDGNRRWARARGEQNPSVGHRYGAEHLSEFLHWCHVLGISTVTAWVASADNIRYRDPDEVQFLMKLAETLIPDALREDGTWRVHVIGQLDVLPDSTARALKEVEAATADLPEAGHLTIAIGYGGREELADAIADLMTESHQRGWSAADLAATVTESDIARHLQTVGDDPDLVIRTSGEQRMSDFLLWQTANSELFFVDAY
jgi:short-chain Z-isoprenyl diphosphate synthase